MRWHSLVLSLLASSALADPPCRTVELRFAPGAADLQIAIWIEDVAGHFKNTAYITRLTGQFGLANRPGIALLKTNFRWPYGRREMVLPVWAHRRNVHYPKVLMGGACGNSPASKCLDKSPCGGDCEDSTIAYHSRTSSYEPFYCSPSGPSSIDAMSCASKGTFSKGAFADAPAYSLYPPRADLTSFTNYDSGDAKNFASLNDLVAVSAATPKKGAPLNPPVSWSAASLPDGDYVAWIELSQESDFNAQHNHPNKADSVIEWDFEGHPFLGQPSVVYKVPFQIGASSYSNSTSSYAGYGSWDGSSGTMTLPDGTITVGIDGTGAGRLLQVNDGVDVYRFKVVVGGCGDTDGGAPTDGGLPLCMPAGPPDPVTEFTLKPTATALDVSFRTPTVGIPSNRFAVRYREGEAPITDDNFASALAAPDPEPGPAGSILASRISGLMPSTAYTVAVRGISSCSQGSHVVSQLVATPAQQFVTLHGCFIATAAFGSDLAVAVQGLRQFRDRTLLDNPLGQLFVGTYYAFSPSAAAAIAPNKRLRATTRWLIAPLIRFSGD